MKAIRVGTVCLLLAMASGAQAAERTGSSNFPQRPIRVIVPQAPGGSNDILARYFGAQVGERLGTQIVVDNRPGAEGMIGTEMVARSNPDGYTYLMASTAFTMNPAVRKLPYDPVKDFEWAGVFGTAPVVLVVGASLPVKTVQDLIALAKSKPNFLTMGSAGGFMHFVSAMFTSHAGLDATIALYKGGAPALIDVMSGQVHAAVGTIVTVGPHLRSGKLRGLATGGAKRAAALPDLPTLAESGVPGYEAAIWWGWAARAGTPAEILNRMNAEIAVVQKQPETAKRYAAEGAELLTMTPAEIRRFIPVDMAKWEKVARAAGMQKH